MSKFEQDAIAVSLYDFIQDEQISYESGWLLEKLKEWVSEEFGD